VHRSYLLVLAASAALLAWGVPRAGCAPIINHTGIPSPAHIITFDELTFPTGTPITSQYAGLGATFSPSLFYNVQPIFFPTAELANFDLVSNINNPVTIQFAHPVTAAAFAVQTNPGTSTFTALLGGVPEETFTAPTALSFVPDLTHANDFFGFQGITFDAIQVTSNTTFFQIDNLQIGAAPAPAPVPEPSSLALLSLGGIALAGWRRWKKRQGTA
jgi:hypothetical protein